MAVHQPSTTPHASAKKHDEQTPFETRGRPRSHTWLRRATLYGSHTCASVLAIILVAASDGLRYGLTVAVRIRSACEKSLLARIDHVEVSLDSENLLGGTHVPKQPPAEELSAFSLAQSALGHHL